MSNASTALQVLGQRLTSQEDRLAKILPPNSSITAGQAAMSALTFCKANPSLLQCDPESIVSAVFLAATDGLIVGGALGHAYLVKYGSKCQYIPGYKGKVQLAYEHPKVMSVRADVHRERDEFQMTSGSDCRVTHTYDPSQDRGESLGYYIVVKLADGAEHVTYMSRAEVEHVRLKASSKNSPAWREDYDQMALGKVFNRAAKWIPMSTSLRSALAHEEAAESGHQPAPPEIADAEVEAVSGPENAPEGEPKRKRSPIDVGRSLRSQLQAAGWRWETLDVRMMEELGTEFPQWPREGWADDPEVRKEINGAYLESLSDDQRSTLLDWMMAQVKADNADS